MSKPSESIPTSTRFRRAVTALFVSGALLAGATACDSGSASGSGGGEPARSDIAMSVAAQQEAVDEALAAQALTAQAAAWQETADEAAAAATPAPTTSAEKQKFAKTRFVANAGLAAGATYQWIIKPYRAGKFKKGASGRTFALIKAGLAGAFAYNRLKAAADNAKGDPLLSKAVAPLTAGIESLKGLGSKLRKGDATDADLGSLQDVITGVKGAGAGAGATVTDKVPSLSQLSGG